MKKIKIMLTAIAIFAVIGSALAFKAKKGLQFWCSTEPTQGPHCPIFVQSSTFTTDPSDLYCSNIAVDCTISAVGE